MCGSEAPVACMECTVLSSHKHQVPIKGEWFCAMNSESLQVALHQAGWWVGYGNHTSVYYIYIEQLCVYHTRYVSWKHVACSSPLTTCIHPSTPPLDTHTHTHYHRRSPDFCLMLCVYVLMVCTNTYVLLRSGLSGHGLAVKG